MATHCQIHGALARPLRLQSSLLRTVTVGASSLQVPSKADRTHSARLSEVGTKTMLEFY